MFNKKNEVRFHEMEEKLSNLYEISKSHEAQNEKLEEIIDKQRERMYEMEKYMEQFSKELGELKAKKTTTAKKTTKEKANV